MESKNPCAIYRKVAALGLIFVVIELPGIEGAQAFRIVHRQLTPPVVLGAVAGQVGLSQHVADRMVFLIE